MMRKKSARAKSVVHITDLHLDHWPQNLSAILNKLEGTQADLILVGGDNGGEKGIDLTVAELKRRQPNASIAWVMGNHDLWGHGIDYLWRGFDQIPATYLERSNLELDWCTVVGTYGHYDLSAGDPSIPLEYYEEYVYMGMVWNDHLIHRDGLSDIQIAGKIAGAFKERYEAAQDRGLPIIVLTHTLPFEPTKRSPRTFFSAYSTNMLIGEALVDYSKKPIVVFCGHTHRPERSQRQGIPVINTGSDYKTVRVTMWDVEA